MDDPYWDLIGERFADICRHYGSFAEKKPVMLLDVQSGRIYAYPFQEFRDDLTERTRASFSEQYQDAVSRGEMVVFVRDNDNRKLRSYSVARKTTAEGGNGKRKEGGKRRGTRLRRGVGDD